MRSTQPITLLHRSAARRMLAALIFVAVASVIPTRAQPVRSASWRQEDPDTVFGFSSSFKDIDPDQFRRICRVLLLSREQRASAMDLYEIYAQRSREADRKLVDYDRAVEQSLAVKDDPSLRRQKEETWKRHTAYRNRVREILIEDFRALLTPEQDGRWPLVERSMRRREAFVLAPRPVMNLDVGRLVERAVHPADPTPEVLAILDEYDAQVDEIATRAAAFRKEYWSSPDARALDSTEEGRRESQRRYRIGYLETAGALPEINARTARRVTPLLPEPSRSSFLDEFFKWAALDGTTLTLHDLDTNTIDGAMKTLPDLSPQTRRAIADAQSAYRSALHQNQDLLLDRVLRDQKAFAADWHDHETFYRARGERFREWTATVTSLRLGYFRSLRAILTEEQLALLPAPLGKAEIIPPSFED